MRTSLTMAMLLLAVVSCSDDPAAPAGPPVLLVEDTLFDVHRTVAPGSSADEVRTLVSGPSETDWETTGTDPLQLRLPTTLYGHSAYATFDFDGDGLYRIGVEFVDLPPVTAEEFRERVETRYGGVLPADTPDPGTGWELALHGIEFVGEGGHMSTGWELLASEGKTVILRAGTPDGFQEPADPTNRNPDIVDFIRSNWLGQDVRDFDTPGNNLAIVHRFTDLPDGPYCSVQLTLRLRGQTSSLSENDSIRLIFPTSGEVSEPFAWWRPIRAFTGSWGVGRDISLEVDLDHLPVDGDGETSILNRITGNVLDVVVEDDTAVDFMILRIRTTGHGNEECVAS